MLEYKISSLFFGSFEIFGGEQMPQIPPPWLRAWSVELANCIWTVG